MATAQLKWTLPAADSGHSSQVDLFDAGVHIGWVTPEVTTFTTGELAPGDHPFSAIVRSKSGATFDSDPSNVAVLTVPTPAVKLGTVSDLTAVLV